MNTLNLSLAVGDAHVDPATDPRMLKEPESLGSRHAPFSHATMWDIVQTQLKSLGIEISQSIHALDRTGNRYFGIAEVKGERSDFADIMAWRSSHDQRFGATFTGGNGVFVCSNLCMFGEIKLSTKQTVNVLDRLRGVIRKLDNNNAHQERKFENYRLSKVSRARSNAFITELVRRDVITGSQVGRVISEWDEPSHAEHAEDGHSVWRMFNAVTEAMKPTNDSRGYLNTLYKRSPKLVEACDELAA
jgi:hypothetical protein